MITWEKFEESHAMTRLPAVAIAVLVALSGCASVEVTKSDGNARTQTPFEARIGLSHVAIPAGSRLVIAKVDGRPAFCTVRPVFFATGEGGRGVCLFDSSGSGYLDKYYILGALRSLTYDAHIAYGLESSVAPTAQERVAIADQAQCQYEAQQATVGYAGYQPTLAGSVGASIAQAAEYNNLLRLCLNARAAGQM
jgi:hypothetical protein